MRYWYTAKDCLVDSLDFLQKKMLIAHRYLAGITKSSLYSTQFWSISQVWKNRACSLSHTLIKKIKEHQNRHYKFEYVHSKWRVNYTFPAFSFTLSSALDFSNAYKPLLTLNFQIDVTKRNGTLRNVKKRNVKKRNTRKRNVA